MQLLTTVDELRDAINSLSPEGRTAAQDFAGYVLANPSVVQNGDELNKAFLASCLRALEQHGWDLSNKYRVEGFLRENNEPIIQLAVSIIRFAMANQGQAAAPKWGWAKKGAALAGGILLSTLFG